MAEKCAVDAQLAAAEREIAQLKEGRERAQVLSIIYFHSFPIGNQRKLSRFIGKWLKFGR